MFRALGGIFSFGSGERIDSSIMGCAPGQSTCPPLVRSSAFFMGPRSRPQITVAKARSTAAMA